MSDIALSSLRVAAEIDAARYTTGADQKVAADRAMTASAQAVGAAISQTDTKISVAGDSLAKLSRQYLDGYKNQERFEQGLRQIGRQLDSGKTDIDGATRLLVGMNQKLGITADASELAAKGQVQLAAAVSMANTQIGGQAIALQQAAVAHAALIAQARADQAAENSRQIAAANQGGFNSVLGVASPSAEAQASASVFQAEFDRLEQMARLRAQQAGSIFADEFNSSVMVNSGKSARASASVFEEAGREADQMAARVAALRAELDPAAAAQDRLNAELSEYSALASKGAISANELAAAQTLARNRAAANQNIPGGANNFAGLNATSQLQDIAITSMMGQSIPTIALQQGTQLGMALQMSLGEQGAAGGAKALIAGLTGLFSPINLVAVGLTAVVAAGIQFGSKLIPQTKSLNEALKDQRQDILDVANAYDLAKISADNYNKSRGIYAGAAARQGQTDLGGAARFTDADVLTSLTRFVETGFQPSGHGVVPTGQLQARPEFSAFSGPIDQFVKNRDYDALGRGVRDITAQNPALQVTGDKILNIAKVGNEAAAALKEGADQLARINSRAPSLADSQLGQDYRDQNNADLVWLQRQQSAALGGIGAKSPEELRQAAMAAEAAKPSPANESNDVTQFKIASAGALAYTQALHQLKEAQDQRLRSLEQTLDSAKLDVELIGKTTAATEGLRLAFQLEQQVREAAAQSNTKADEAEIARLKAKAIEYGKQRALQEALDTIHGQEIDLETQRAELGLVGDNALARQRSAAALKTEQDIRKLGIPLYGQEANAMRANTAALSDQADAMAKASLQADLLFERSQILRNEQDQQIASRLQSAGLPVDLNSVEAGMMRYNMALSEAKDNFKGFFTDMAQGLREGKSLWDSFKDAGINALSKLADKLIDRGLDGIFNSLFGGQSAGGGLLGDLLSGNSGSQSNASSGASSFLSKLFGVAGGQSVASMQVQAATVFINGAPVGGLGAISALLGGQSGTPFQANADLMDVLGRPGAANQNYIQTRIDQAFGTGGVAQDLIQSRIDQAFGTSSAGLGGIFSPAGGFASVVGGGGLTGSISQYASAIKMIESAGSGGYSALGPVLKSGDQALGAYQIMRSNLPSWSKDTFGSSMSQSSFMSNPAAQDAIFEKQFGKLLDKYGNSNDAASAWFTGGPLSSGAGKMDVLGTTGSVYVDKFNAALSKLGGVTDHATSSISSLGSGTSSLLTSIGGAATDATKGLGTFSSALSQFPAAPSMGGGGGGGGGLFSWLGGLFGGGGGGIGSFSPGVQADFASGALGLGLFADGTENAPAGWSWVGERGPELRKLRAGDVIRSNPRSMQMAASQGGVPAANDSRPAQNIHQTNNFIFRENPATPASQNQIATKSARALEKLQRTA